MTSKKTQTQNDDLGVSDPALDAEVDSVLAGITGEATDPEATDPEATDPAADDSEEDAPEAAAPKAAAPKAAAPKAAAPKAAPKKVLSEKVTIILDDPGSGSNSQFFGLNGRGYQIKFNEEVTVPRALLNVLDEAITTRTIPVEEGGVIERSSKRFPYRIVREG
jgi:hypothetical protein